jgi:adenine-specific DNA methylase
VSKELLAVRKLMDSGIQVGGFGCDRAFKVLLLERDVQQAQEAAQKLFGEYIAVIDPMAGGGSIPLESARLGFHTLANEYNPVACSVLEATVDYPFRFGTRLAERTRHWAAEWRRRFNARLRRFFPNKGRAETGIHVFARTVPCPDTGFDTPLVPDWHLLKPKDSPVRVWAEPVVDKNAGTWSVRMVDNRNPKNRGKQPPSPTYSGGKGISLLSGQQIPGDWIKAKAKAGEMRSALYAVELRSQGRGEFVPPDQIDLDALDAAEKELQKHRSAWENSGIIPTELYPEVSSDPRPRVYGMQRWADLFSPRQLLGFGVLVEELQPLRPEIVKAEGKELGEAVVHLLAFAIDKFVNHNCTQTRWENTRSVIKSKMDRHDYAFKYTFAEMAPCGAGAGLAWAIDNTLEAYEHLAELAGRNSAKPVEISLGSATSLPTIADKSITAVVVDPPYADNVQYAELADFFYVWLKRTQGHRRPEWFSSYLCDHSEEAVVNVSRFRNGRPGRVGQVSDLPVAASSAGASGAGGALNRQTGGLHHKALPTAEARRLAHAHYQRLMADTFKECRRILRDEGVLTVMFTHKKQEAWEALFTSLVQTGFIITATWPVKTESEHSLHQAKKNTAQSTVVLAARKRDDAEVGYFDAEMKQAIRHAAQKGAERLQKEGLNPVDQLVGSFGSAMEVYSRYSEVRTDTGNPVGVDRALDEESEAVTNFRIQQLASVGQAPSQVLKDEYVVPALAGSDFTTLGGPDQLKPGLQTENPLRGVEAEGRFYLLCWDVLQAAEFRFNEAKLLGHAVGMDVDSLVTAGLVSKSGDKIKLLSAKDRKRPKKLEQEEIEETLFGAMPSIKKKRVRKGDVLMVHPNDAHFRTALDGCHALALRYVEAGGGNPGLGAARQLAVQQGWKSGSPVARLMEALLKAAPRALWHEKGMASAAAQYPEFRAWHAMIEPLFGVTPPEWVEELEPQGELDFESEPADEAESETEDAVEANEE